MAQTDRRGFQFPMQHKPFSFFVFILWSMSTGLYITFPPNRNFVMNILLYCLRKSCGGGEYDVMIIDAVKTYFLFRGGDIIPC